MSANNTAATKCHYWRIGIDLQVALCFVAGSVGCARAPAKAPPPAPLSVPVSCPIEREVADPADFTAMIATVDAVEVRAHGARPVNDETCTMD